ncbi:ferritin-like domain-containing protein [Robiginitomaculum antarcticum]|uniref:ferritin-like domain-containing protein n=1 Tax=Robiginitomaculum antarcticum TaxID=437507 RepID=UPI0004772CE5|nr:ferritin-like domain-containing protein [Robiginitomaculum antarcticum]
MNAVRHSAIAVLRASEPRDKVTAAFALRDNLDSALFSFASSTTIPTRPARPAKPVLVEPGDLARRRLGTPAGRGALLHAVAHIEFNAIDMAADMVARFADHDLIADQDRTAFILDWSGVCHDEARHFGLMCDRMADLGITYGDLPAHDGLWQAAEATRDDIAARLAIAPMVLEARGLDVTPGMITKLKSVGDHESAKVLQIIYDDEIGHVAAGRKWFEYICMRQGLEVVPTFHKKVRKYFAGLLKPPFNEQARDLAGMKKELYMPLAAD